MKYSVNTDIYYGCYGEYTYVRNVADRMDYLYNEICFDILEYIRASEGCGLKQLCSHLLSIYETDSEEELCRDIEAFLKELEEAGILKKTDIPEDAVPIEGHGDLADEPEEYIRDFIQQICCGEQRLLTVCLELTYRCNEKCIHCYIDDPENESSELSFSDYKKLLDDIRGLGCMGILLTGGEPTLHRDFLKIAFYAKQIGLMVDIYTNGLCMDDSMMDQLIALKPNSISFSFYGGNAQSHDIITGVPGSFEKSLRTMMMCKCAGIDTFIKTVVMKQNFDSYEELLKLGRRIHTRVLSSLSVIPTHQGRMPDEFRLMDPDKYKKILELEYQYGLHSTRAASGEREDYVCASGLSALSIDPFGTVYPCNANPIVLGNIRNDEIGAIWNDSDKLRSIRSLRFNQISDRCMSCEDKNWCGICMGNAYRENGCLKPCSDTCILSKVSHEVYKNHAKGGEMNEEI